MFLNIKHKILSFFFLMLFKLGIICVCFFYLNIQEIVNENWKNI